MSYNGSGTFVINSAGQPVVTGTVISSTAFNALTADLATGLSTAITKDGQTTTTSRILFAQGISSTLVTDATSATTGSIITAGGISTQKALWVGTTSNFSGLMRLNNTTAGASTQIIVNGRGLFTGGTHDPADSSGAGVEIGYDTGSAYGFISSIQTGVANKPLRIYGTDTLFYNSTSLIATINTVGLGIGMTPTAGYGALQAYTGAGGTQIGIGLAATVGLLNYFGNDFQISSNATLNSAGAWTARYTAAALMELRADGSIVFQSNTGLTAGNSFSPTERARIGTDGSFLVGGTTNVGAGSASIAASLSVGLGGAVNKFVRVEHATGSITGSDFIYFTYNGAQIGGVAQSGTTAVVYNTTSDARLKKWRADQRNFRSIISGITVGDVEWTADPGSRMLAVMAQQTNEFYPDAITPGKTDADMWQADYGRLAPLALWGVKDLYAENEALKASMAELTTRLAALESK